MSPSFSYASGAVPADYRCGKCGAKGCKIWRKSSCFAAALLCASCAMADQGKVGTVNENGLRPSEHGTTDQIGYYVPAVPCEGSVGYWGYTSVPDAGVAWWRALPTYPAVTT